MFIKYIVSMLFISPQVFLKKDQIAMSSQFCNPIKKSLFFITKLKERSVNNILYSTKNKAILINKSWEQGDLNFQQRYYKKENLIFLNY